ncbi:MAG: hypothetical protein LBS97_00440 [Treponema sp.]|jgi:hypothetical protein|nr:hypothetical protein [Treponema sp.]
MAKSILPGKRFIGGQAAFDTIDTVDGADSDFASASPPGKFPYREFTTILKVVCWFVKSSAYFLS